MSSDVAIRVEDLGKSYTIRHQQSDHVTLAQVALERAKHPLRRNQKEDFWALREVGFEVNQGEVLGLIGRNGAGKSTLLKLLTRITAPSTGRIDLWGRVGSLLEVGTGFHPELTGRENIYLNGSILGMSRKEIDRQFDAIVEFAGVEKFLDTPVKRYSSGMYVRLAFAVAAHLETEILLLDEVLAVGDGDFQQKCFQKVNSLSSSGRSVILVSHNMGSISTFTDRAAYLEAGRLVTVGPTDAVVAEYLERGGATANQVDVSSRRRDDPAHGREARILRVSMEHGLVAGDDDIRVRVVARASEPLGPLRIGQSIRGADGTAVGTSFSEAAVRLEPGVETGVDLVIDQPRLAPGHYQLTVSLGIGNEAAAVRDYDVVYDAVHFEVAPTVTADGIVTSWHRVWGAMRFDPPRILSADVDTLGR